LMFAARNARQPVRHVWTGEQLHSNCARGARELALLVQHGQSIKVIELEAELFFGAIASLDQSLTASLVGAHTVIADWTRVRHVDSSIALAVARWMRAAKAAKVQVLHAGAGHEPDGQASHYGSNALEFLNQHFAQAVLLPDLDRALEIAENALIGELAGERSHQTTVMHEQIALFAGLTATQLKQMQASMRERLYQAGEVIFNAGDASDSMLVVLQGRASVMVRAGDRIVRLTSMRRGGVLGEMGFLDRAPRSATVVAEEPLLAYVLTRDAFDDLRESWPETAYILIQNLTLNLAVRLRHTNRLALARGAVD
jgi:sulfate permease, SulP family